METIKKKSTGTTKKKSGFILYDDYKQHFEMLNDKDVRDLLFAIFDYHKDGTSHTLVGMAKMAFSFIKVNIDIDKNKYLGVVKRNRVNGSGGGRPKKPKEPTGLSGNPKNPAEPKEPDTDTDTDTGTVTVKKKVVKESHGDYGNVKLTSEEYKRLQSKHSPQDLGTAISILDNYCEANGKKYKSYYAVLKDTGWVWDRIKSKKPQREIRTDQNDYRVVRPEDYDKNESCMVDLT